MSKFFGQTFKENIIYNQKALNDYHLALHNLLSAIQKGNKLDKEQLFLMKELVESMQNTLMDLQKLQIKKMGIGDKSRSSFFLQKDILFSSPKNKVNSQNIPSPRISIKNNTPSPPPRIFIDKKK